MADGQGFRHPDRPGMLIQPHRVLAALTEAIELVGQVVESTASVTGDARWRDVGRRIRRAARELAPP